MISVVVSSSASVQSRVNPDAPIDRSPALGCTGFRAVSCPSLRSWQFAANALSELLTRHRQNTVQNGRRIVAPVSNACPHGKWGTDQRTNGDPLKVASPCRCRNKADAYPIRDELQAFQQSGHFLGDDRFVSGCPAPSQKLVVELGIRPPSHPDQRLVDQFLKVDLSSPSQSVADGNGEVERLFEERLRCYVGILVGQQHERCLVGSIRKPRGLLRC